MSTLLYFHCRCWMFISMIVICQPQSVPKVPLCHCLYFWRVTYLPCLSTVQWKTVLVTCSWVGWQGTVFIALCVDTYALLLILCNLCCSCGMADLVSAQFLPGLGHRAHIGLSYPYLKLSNFMTKIDNTGLFGLENCYFFMYWHA